MSLRIIKPTDVVGKTITAVENTSVNVVKLSFTDGTALELWTETVIHTPGGSISGIFVEDAAQDYPLVSDSDSDIGDDQVDMAIIDADWDSL